MLGPSIGLFSVSVALSLLTSICRFWGLSYYILFYMFCCYLLEACSFLEETEMQCIRIQWEVDRGWKG